MVTSDQSYLNGSLSQQEVLPEALFSEMEEITLDNSKENNAPIKMSVVSKSELLREGIILLLAKHLNINVIGSYCQFSDPNSLLPNPAGHIVLLDGGVGLQVVKWIAYWHNQSPTPKIIVLELGNDIGLILDCIEAGASGYILQGATIVELAEVIRLVRYDKAQCSPKVTAELFARLVSYKSKQALPALLLTSREQEVLGFLAQDYTNQEIAQQLSIEVRTVKQHVHNILEKLKARHRWDAVRLAKEQGLVFQARDT